MAAYTEERGVDRLVEKKRGRTGRMIEFFVACAICGGDDFQLGTSSSVVTDFEKVV